MFDVGIIGCGIIGAAAAFELSKYRVSTLILEGENDVADGTTKANSAILHAGYDPEPGTLMAKLNVEGSFLAERICRDLDVPYRKTGSLVLAFSDRDCETVENLYRRGKQNGVPGLSVLNAEQVLGMEPNLSLKVRGALYAPTAAVVSPWEYCLALAETAVENGAVLRRDARVTKIERIPEGYRITASGRPYEARYVINAAGVHAEEVHNLAAAPSFHIIPMRGEYFILDKSEGRTVSRVIFQCPTERGKGVLVAPTVGGNLIVGPNAEQLDRGAGENTATTASGMAFVAKTAKESVPGLDFRQTIRSFAGVRAASDRDDFIIEQAKGAPGFLDLAGIRSPGLTAAPAIAETAIGILEESGLKREKKTDFRARRRRIRFADLSPEEKARLVKEDPSYGRVICRCETVTEGEILACMKTPIPPCSVDGVKRRVNAGMGRCQGGFCGPRVVEILSRELHIPPDRVLKDKDGSYILTGKTRGGGGNV